MQSDLFELSGNAPAAARPDRLLRPLRDCFRDIPPGWREVTDRFVASDAGRALIEAVDSRVRQGATVYPPTPFRALERLRPEQVRVIILGQDPYHGPGQAQGVAFGVGLGQRKPPSLRNIFLEVEADLGRRPHTGQDLAHWTSQGVLLLNTALTVEEAQPMSHAKLGWETLADALLAQLAATARPLVVMLWGAAAQRKAALFTSSRHRVLMANHPSPLSASRGPTPFLGSRHFSRANDWLAQFHGAEGVIDW
jgi:uracil-DNA glycosylase